MELQRLVVDDPSDPTSLDFHPGLTVAFHAGDEGRGRLVDHVVTAMGPAPSGVHLEFVDERGHHLVAFRPRGSAHRVVDVGAGIELGARYRLADGRVSLLDGATFDAARTRRLLCVGAPGTGTGPSDGVGDDLVRQLSRVDPTALWPAAENLRRRSDDLATAMVDLPVGDVGTIAALDELASLHEDCRRTRRSHRTVQVVGAVLAVVSATAALVLPRATDGIDPLASATLVALAVACALATVVEEVVVRGEGRRERRVLAAAGFAGPAELSERLGPLTDRTRRRALLELAEAHREATARWYGVAGRAPLEGALRRRDRITELAERNRTSRYAGLVPGTYGPGAYGPGPLAPGGYGPAGDEQAGGGPAGETDPDDVLAALAERLDTLRHAGPTAGTLPLLLEGTVDGLAPEVRARLLDGILRLAGSHQIVLVTGDPAVVAWATEPSVVGSLTITGPTPTTGADGTPATGTGSVAPVSGPVAEPVPAG